MMMQSEISLQKERAAMPTSGQRMILFGVAAVTLLLDQLSKAWIENNLPLGEAVYPFQSIEHIFRIIHVQNRGAAFGLFQGGGLFFTLVAFLVAAFIVYYNHHLPAGHHPFRIALGLQLGGALGNVIDRFRLGHVTDFLHFNLRPLVEGYPRLDFELLNWPVFNLADTAIVTGVLILAYLLLTEKDPEAAGTPDVAQRAPAAEQRVPLSSATGGGGPQPAAEPGDTRLARFILLAAASLLVSALLTLVVLIASVYNTWFKRRR